MISVKKKFKILFTLDLEKTSLSRHGLIPLQVTGKRGRTNGKGKKIHYMKYVFVDFEMNAIRSKFKEARAVCRSEIIEIGAVMLNDTYEEIAEFRQYVKPEYNEISKKYEDLTGVTNDKVKDAPAFFPAMVQFRDWCIAASSGDSFCIYAWSDTDLRQIQREMQLKKVDSDQFSILTKEWVDFQKQFCDILGLEHRISLEVAVGSISKKFEGTMHDALWDARNTAVIFALSKNEDEFERTMRPIIDMIRPSGPMTFTMGDLFKGFDLKS